MVTMQRLTSARGLLTSMSVKLAFLHCLEKAAATSGSSYSLRHDMSTEHTRSGSGIATPPGIKHAKYKSYSTYVWNFSHSLSKSTLDSTTFSSGHFLSSSKSLPIGVWFAGSRSRPLCLSIQRPQTCSAHLNR